MQLLLLPLMQLRRPITYLVDRPWTIFWGVSHDSDRNMQRRSAERIVVIVVVILMSSYERSFTSIRSLCIINDSRNISNTFANISLPFQVDMSRNLDWISNLLKKIHSHHSVAKCILLIVGFCIQKSGIMHAWSRNTPDQLFILD